MRDKRASEHENSPKMGRIGNRPYWLLNLSLPIRAAHQIGAGVFLGAYLLNLLPGPPRLYLGLVLISGVLLMLSEWLRHRQIFREVAGLITLTKILLLGAAYHGYLPPTGTVLLAFIIASIGAHAPKNVRHRLLF